MAALGSVQAQLAKKYLSDGWSDSDGFPTHAADGRKLGDTDALADSDPAAVEKVG